jgi:dipeptidyl aminopeptidase/acylaminoacyl peptidase
MRKYFIYPWVILIVVLLSACSPTKATRTNVPTEGSSTTALSIPTATIPAPTQAPATETPPAWVGRGYTGRLILVLFGPKGNQLVELDLASGTIKTLFQAPENSWLAAAVVSPDDQQILLSYGPPPPGGKPNFGYSDLYLMPISGSSPPQPFLTRKDPQESFFDPAWAPDGKSIYYTHLYRIDPKSSVPAFQNDIEQATMNGEMKPLIPHSLWPALSQDGTKLAYLNADPAYFGNDLYLAKPDGSNRVPVLQPGINPPVDDHFFTKDGNLLIFSMVNFQPAPTRFWWEKLLGVEVASAHSVPSDWYMVSIGGGEPQRLTNLNDVGMSADLSPDGQRVAFISATGLYIMNLDGSDIYMLSNHVYIGTVDWIP